MGELERIYLSKADENVIIKDKAKEETPSNRWTEITKDKDKKVDDLIIDLIGFYQEQGFNCGFRTAVKLLVGDR